MLPRTTMIIISSGLTPVVAISGATIPPAVIAATVAEPSAIRRTMAMDRAIRSGTFGFMHHRSDVFVHAAVNQHLLERTATADDQGHHGNNFDEEVNVSLI